jgi:hypothetical protein
MKILDLSELARQEKARRHPSLLDRLIAWQSGRLILPPENEKRIIAIFEI